MTDRVYPSSKPTANGTTTTAGVANLSFPATKGQLYNASRPPYPELLLLLLPLDYPHRLPHPPPLLHRRHNFLGPLPPPPPNLFSLLSPNTPIQPHPIIIILQTQLQVQPHNQRSQSQQEA
ncbi:hypothetical protein CsSME_00007694 [Camellia sinensis var. sinensis]